MLPFQIAPVVYNFYVDYKQRIERLQLQISRYEGLEGEAEFWEKENQRAKQEQEQILAGLLPGKNRELVGTRMQGLVSQLAQNARITIKNLAPPDTALNTGEWLLVIQTMQFEADSKSFIDFLQAIKNAKERLAIVNLEVRSSRNKLTGTIKITGFSRIPPD
jgi:hypothetical protein